MSFAYTKLPLQLSSIVLMVTMRPSASPPCLLFTQVLLAVVCTQFIRVFDLSANAETPVHTFYLPATAEDASNDGAGSSIRDVELVPPAPPADNSCALSGEAAAEGWGSETGTPPELLGTAIVLTGAGRLYAKGIPVPSKADGTGRDSRGGGDSGDDSGYAHDGEVRHKLIIPLALEEGPRILTSGGSDGRRESGPAGGGGGSAAGATVGGSNAGGRGVDGAIGSESGGSRGRSESVGGSGSGREEDEEVESPVSGSAEESSSYLYLNAFTGCAFEDSVDDSPDENVTFAEPGLRRRGSSWATATAASGAVPSVTLSSSETDRLLAMAPGHLTRTAAAASAGALHFSHRMNVLVVARGGKSTICLRLRGTGATTEVVGGFVLLPRLKNSSGGGSLSDVSATLTAQADGAGSTPAGSATAVATITSTTLEAKSCLPPYTRFLDYWDGAGDLAGEEGAAAATSASAALVCVAAAGGKGNAGRGKMKSDRVLAMKIGGGQGDRHAVSLNKRKHFQVHNVDVIVPDK